MINPIAFQLGPFIVRYYGILMVLGFVIGYFLLKKLMKEKKLDFDLDNFYFYMIIVTLVGARLFHVLFYDFSYYFANPIKIFYVWEGGLASHGAIIANILFVYFYTKKRKLNFYDIADILVIPFALGACFIRIGNFINQELVGNPTDSIFGWKFDNYQELRHPVQLYQAFSDFVLFWILYLLRDLPKGFVFWLFISLFSVFRFVTEFYKDLPFYYLTLAQYLSIVMFLVSGFFLIRLYKNTNKSQ